MKPVEPSDYITIVNVAHQALHDKMVLFQTVTLAIIFGVGATYDKMSHIPKKARIVFLFSYILYTVTYLVDVLKIFWHMQRSLAAAVEKVADLALVYSKFADLDLYGSFSFHIMIALGANITIGMLLFLQRP